MKTRCNQFFEAIATSVTDSTEPGGEVAAHLRECDTCRNKLAELKAVAKLHSGQAAMLPDPRMRLSRQALERALDHHTKVPTFGGIRLRPILASAFALLLVAIVAVSRRAPEKSIETGGPIQSAESESRTEAASIEPTMLALRHDLQTGREQIFASTPTGVQLRHYRMKDVGMELLSTP